MTRFSSFLMKYPRKYRAHELHVFLTYSKIKNDRSPRVAVLFTLGNGRSPYFLCVGPFRGHESLGLGIFIGR